MASPSSRSTSDPRSPLLHGSSSSGGRFLYAVRVDTTQGFELCPADACRVDDLFCPVDTPSPGDDEPPDGVGTDGTSATGAPLFQIIDGFRHELVGRYERFLEANGIHIAGIEFILDAAGDAYTYDINTNTNYNRAAEDVAGVRGMEAIAEYLGRQLEVVGSRARPATAGVGQS